MRRGTATRETRLGPHPTALPPHPPGRKWRAGSGSSWDRWPRPPRSPGPPAKAAGERSGPRRLPGPQAAPPRSPPQPRPAAPHPRDEESVSAGARVAVGPGLLVVLEVLDLHLVVEHGHAAGKRREPGSGGREEAAPEGHAGGAARDVMRRRVGVGGAGRGIPGVGWGEERGGWGAAGWGSARSSLLARPFLTARAPHGGSPARRSEAVAGPSSAADGAAGSSPGLLPGYPRGCGGAAGHCRDLVLVPCPCPCPVPCPCASPAPWRLSAGPPQLGAGCRPPTLSSERSPCSPQSWEKGESFLFCDYFCREDCLSKEVFYWGIAFENTLPALLPFCPSSALSCINLPSNLHLSVMGVM